MQELGRLDLSNKTNFQVKLDIEENYRINNIICSGRIMKRKSNKMIKY